MALTDTDRRRFTAATVLTLLALPALWLANTSDNSAAPNLAVAGLDRGVDVAVGANDAKAPHDDDPGQDTPAYFEGPASAAGAGQSAIAIPAKPLVEGITGTATFHSSVADDVCISGGLPSGSLITVVNLANNRSVTCTTILAPGDDPGAVVMHTSAFAGIADLTDAPISVEIRR
jgi:hypothetical protein